ncbi:MAG: HEPN domain-containing protein [Kiritimatiellae bacterium]|nr:HEPN domain-containing protein [Kiritimatiellia bacterium]
MTPENSAANAADEAARGDDALRAARVLLEAGLFNDSVSRAYFAAYHYASALLLNREDAEDAIRRAARFIAACRPLLP